MSELPDESQVIKKTWSSNTEFNPAKNDITTLGAIILTIGDKS